MNNSPNSFLTNSDTPLHQEGYNALTSFYTGVSTSVNQTLAEWGAILPDILKALTVLFIGILIGYVIEHIFRKLGDRLRLANFWQRIGFDDLLKKANIKSSPSQLVGKFLKGVIITYFLRVSAGIMGFVEIEEFLRKVIGLVPDIIIAVLILLFALQFAGTASSLLQNLLRIGDKQARWIIAAVAKNTIIAFGIMTALSQIGIAENLVEILFTALVAMLALAGGLALGLGGKEFVYDILKDMRANADSETDHPAAKKRGSDAS